MTNNRRQMTDWLPTTKKEMNLRGWEEADVILFSGDAYIDHPSFGTAVIGRLLEKEGLKVAVVPQPNWRDDLRDFRKFGKPNLFFAVTAGVMDSMINHYTANKRLRSNDAYTPDGRSDMRPDRAVTVYSKILKDLYPDVPIVLGGIEASLRRVTHYDYWDDSLHKTI
ncbi:MAG: YgiQ family radical SAM protein, partial [Fermentimonas sp.]|nr:YgiQ family radical SAM protein [Fermentimonas sp.]